MALRSWEDIKNIEFKERGPRVDFVAFMHGLFSRLDIDNKS